jgi:hypothetical protein
MDSDMTEIEQLRREVNELRERVAVLEAVAVRRRPRKPRKLDPAWNYF